MIIVGKKKKIYELRFFSFCNETFGRFLGTIIAVGTSTEVRAILLFWFWK
jgi:hypothetical protein